METIKKDQDVILLIMNCLKYRKKALFQKQKWLHKLPSNIIYYHVIGTPLLHKEYVLDDTQNVLFVNCPDDYINLPKKVIRAFEAIQKEYNFKYIFKTDDDQYIYNIQFFDNLQFILKNNSSMIHYGGNIITLQKSQISTYNRIHNELPSDIILKPTKYSNGRFYFLSQTAIMNLIRKKDSIEKEYIEDYAIGFHLDSKLKEFLLFISSDTYFRDIDNLPDWIEFRD